MRRSIAFLAVLVGLAATAWGQLPGSLIAGGGFEGTLEGWEKAEGTAALDEAVAHGGKSSVRLEGAGALQTPLIPYHQEFVHVALSVRTEGVRPGSKAGADVTWYDAERKPIDHAEVGLTAGTEDWAQHEQRFFWEEAQGAVFFRLSLRLWGTEGKAWFDDVVVEATEPPEAFRKVPLLKTVENSPPRVWPLPELQPDKAVVDVGTMEVNFSPDLDFMVRSKVSGAPDIPRIDVALAQVGEGPGAREAGYEAAEGFYYRHKARVESRTGYPALEVYDEFFRGSPILSHFVRLYLANDTAVGRLQLGFRVPQSLSRVSTFDAYALRDEALEGKLVSLWPGWVSKPFVVVHNVEDTAGLVIYCPIPAEMRRWYLEDYVVESARGIVMQPVRDGASTRLTWDFTDLKAGSGGYEHSFDFALFLMPYAGTVKEALAQFQAGDTDLTADAPPLGRNPPISYWTAWMPDVPEGARLLRMARYYPREFASWIDAARAGCYGHWLGHAWGDMTQQMQGLRTDPLAERALARDHAFRTLAFFLERANDHGAPPDLMTSREVAARLANPEDYYNHVSGEYWEYRMGEFMRLMRSPFLTDPEKERVYQRLQRAAVLFDPQEHGSWTEVLPGGGYWFRHRDLPAEPPNPFVISAHARSAGVAGQFCRLARQTGHQQDAAWWEQAFKRGVDGLLYAMGQDWMWTPGARDGNELRYARTEDGPQWYHTLMMTSWLPHVIRLAREIGDYRVDELVGVETRLMKAQYLQEEPQGVKMAQDFLDGIARGKP
jgi:hypothetical protein